MESFSNEDFEDDGRDLERFTKIFVPTIFGSIFIFGLCGNLLTVLVLVSNRQIMRKPTNILISNLVLADLLSIVFVVPFGAAEFLVYHWPFGEIWCKFVQYIAIVPSLVSVYTMLIMSVDRFLIHTGTSTSIRSEQNAYKIIGILWIIILLSCLPALPAHGLTYLTIEFEDRAVCTFNQEYNHAVFQISFVLTSYVIPLFIVCLFLLGMRFWKAGSTIDSARQSAREEKRVTQLVVVLVFVFAVCWLPLDIILILQSLHLYGITDATVSILVIAIAFGCMTICVNPILYGVLSDDVRKGIQKILCGTPPTGLHSIVNNELANEKPLFTLNPENGGDSESAPQPNQMETFKNQDENTDVV